MNKPRELHELMIQCYTKMMGNIDWEILCSKDKRIPTEAKSGWLWGSVLCWAWESFSRSTAVGAARVRPVDNASDPRIYL